MELQQEGDAPHYVEVHPNNDFFQLYANKC